MTLADVQRVQGQLITLLEQSGLSLNDRAKFIRAIKNIQTQEQLAEAIPALQDRVSTLIESAARRKSLEAIRKELRTASKDLLRCSLSLLQARSL